jgi:hypothetical protein
MKVTICAWAGERGGLCGGHGGTTRVIPLWTVIASLSVVVAVESVAIIALTRQAGPLHPRAARSARSPPFWLGPQQGSQAGTVITAGAAMAGAHLEELLGQARRSPAGQAAAR